MELKLKEILEVLERNGEVPYCDGRYLAKVVHKMEVELNLLTKHIHKLHNVIELPPVIEEPEEECDLWKNSSLFL